MNAPLDANEVRKDFELSMTFGIDGVPGDVGCLQRNAFGRYESIFVQYAWLGYLARASSEHAQRERLSADRHIGNGDVTAMRYIMSQHPVGPHTSDTEAIREFARAILKHFKGMPT